MRIPARTLALPLAACAALTLTACGGSSAASDAKSVTVYSADGLKGENGDGWYDKVFKDFEKKTGITVKYVEGGSGEMVQRAAREKSNTQADVLVTLPPFIQQADKKGLLTAYEPEGSDQVDGADRAADGTWTSVVNNYFGFIHNTKELKTPPRTWEELLAPAYKEKIQYSTPGVAGDGTAVLIKAMHDFGGKEPAMAYLKKLQANNVGPSASTGKLAPKVDKGELLVANGDVQMNFAQSKDMPHLGIWFPAKGDGKPTSFALPTPPDSSRRPRTARTARSSSTSCSPSRPSATSARSAGASPPARTSRPPTPTPSNSPDSWRAWRSSSPTGPTSAPTWTRTSTPGSRPPEADRPPLGHGSLPKSGPGPDISRR